MRFHWSRWITRVIATAGQLVLNRRRTASHVFFCYGQLYQSEKSNKAAVKIHFQFTKNYTIQKNSTNKVSLDSFG